MKNQISLMTAISREIRALKIWFKYTNIVWLIIVSKLFVKGTPFMTMYLSARVINLLIEGSSRENIAKMVIITLSVTAILAIISSFFQKWKDIMDDGFWDTTYKILADKKASMDFVDADSQKVADLHSQICQSNNWAGWGLFRSLTAFESFMDAVVSIACGLVLSVKLFLLPVTDTKYVFLNNPLIAAILIAFMVGASAMAGYFMNIRKRAWSSYADDARLGNRMFSAYGWFSQDTSRAADIRLYRQDKITTTYMNMGDAFTEKSSLAKKLKGRYGLVSFISTGGQSIVTGVVYLFVCLKAWAGAFPIGSATQYIGAVTGVFFGINTLLTALEDIRANARFLADTFEFLDYPNNMYQGSLTTEKRSDTHYEVEFRDVSFKYPGSDNYALKSVNLKFTVGEKLAVVGMNGSGKTTFIKLLCRLYDPTEGTILLNGIDIKKYRYDEYMNIFSIVFQDFKLFAMPLGENVATSSDYDKDEVTRCLEKAGFADRLKQLPKGLDTFLYKKLDKEGVEVSGGEAQKIALARALYKDAPFVILDEPTAALDPVAEAEIYSKFNDIVGDKTAVYISHRLSSCKFCDEIAVFHEGGVIQKGTHEQLLADTTGKYYELWNAQAQYYNDDVKEAC